MTFTSLHDMTLAFMDLEKAYDCIPREDVSQCARDQQVPEKYITVKQSRACETRVRSAPGDSNNLRVDVGSALSQFLLIIFVRHSDRESEKIGTRHSYDGRLCGPVCMDVVKLICTRHSYDGRLCGPVCMDVYQTQL